MTNHFDHGDMVHNILAVRGNATAEQEQAGRGWYPTAHRIVDAIASATGTDPERVCFALSALSPRNPWRWNVADAYAYCSARSEGRTMPRATTFKCNQLRAWQALGQDGHPWIGAAPKVQAFVRAILGDDTAVAVDTWAVRVATGKALIRRGRSLSARQYAAVVDAFTEAAALYGEPPASMQAITWLVAQTEGLATNRTSRPDLTFKSGTPEFVKELLS